MHPDSGNPLVSIGIPTFNRSVCLARAVESALAQDYDNLEIVISNNASTDETAVLCAELGKRDTRIRYIRQPENIGVVNNFRRVFEASRGVYFTWLSDDDWLDPSYISQCMHFLRNNEEYVLVCGTGKYYKRGEFSYESSNMDLTDDSPAARVLSYYRKVNFDGVFYGVGRSDLLAGLELRNVLGGDWLFSAAVAYHGKVKMLETTSIHRSMGGASQDMESLGLSVGASKFQAKNAHLTIALAVLRDVGWRSPTYSSAGKSARLFLALEAASAIIQRFYLPERLVRARRRARAYARALHRLLDRYLLWRFHARTGGQKER
jgi:glycosyltransferase involved in cell wall biosynthesis